MRASGVNLTGGSLSRGLIALTGPMLASTLLQNAQSLIDLFWVGKLGVDAVAAIAVSGTVLMLLMPLVMGMSTGTVAIVARAVGANRPEDAAETAGHSLLLALLMGAATGAVGWVVADDLCRLLGASPEVAAMGVSYLRINFLGSFTLYGLFIANSVFQSAGNTVTPMVAMLFANGVNLGLDPILIFGLLGAPRMGVRGAAVATVVAQAASMAWVAWLLVRGAAGFRIWTGGARLRWTLVWRILRIGIPSSGQMLARSLMALALMRIVASCGTAAVAAYGIAMRFHMILLMPAFALGNSAATMVGQNLGAGRPDRAARAAWMATAFDAGLMVVAAGFVLATAPALVRVFNASGEVIWVGANCLYTLAPSFVFVGLGVVLGRALQGAGDTLPPMLITIFSLWCLQVPLAVWLSRHFRPPTQGIWLAMALATTAHGLLTAGWFLAGRWKQKRV